MSTPETFRSIIVAASERLEHAGVASARLDAEVLLAAAAGADRTRLYIDADRVVPDTTLAAFHGLLDRRLRREPLSYILATREFWSLEFTVTPDVLIPRPETEGVIEAALQICSDRDRPVRICDVGTGSGCIAIVLARELPAARICAIDRSLAALRVARSNAARHGVADRVDLLAGDLLSAVAEESFDLIVSNPPYACDSTLPTLEPELSWEPRDALSGGEGGMTVIRKLLPAVARCLRSEGGLVMEIGFDQREAVAELMQMPAWGDFSIRPDYQGHPRVLVGQIRR